jgi:hypothetical protein
MKMQTAINQLKKEQDFLGISMPTLLKWIEKDGRMVFSEKTVEAFNVYNDGIFWVNN